MRTENISGLPVGPGSQPGEEDGAELGYLPMPKAMQTYDPPSLPEAEQAHACPQGLELLESLLVQLRSYRVLEPSRILNLAELPERDLDLVDQALGQGEVGILFAAEAGPRIQETRLAGVWRVRSQDADGGLMRDEIEVAEIPGVVRETLCRSGRTTGVSAQEPPPETALAARSILAELDEKVVQWRFGDLPHVVNLTLLPHTPEDLESLDRSLGRGPLTILSRGYGNCRITATAMRHCWWVQHFNSDDRLILNTLEVVDVPAAALAAQEDIEDSTERLALILEALR